jgi:hypothetical protein
MRYKQHIYDYVKKNHAQQFQPYDRSWHSRNKLFDDWTSFNLNTFTKIKCCALCGYAKLSHHNEHFKKRKNMYNNEISPIVGCTPYGIATCIMAKYTTNENGTFMFMQKM